MPFESHLFFVLTTTTFLYELGAFVPSFLETRNILVFLLGYYQETLRHLDDKIK